MALMTRSPSALVDLLLSGLLSVESEFLHSVDLKRDEQAPPSASAGEAVGSRGFYAALGMNREWLSMFGGAEPSLKRKLGPELVLVTPSAKAKGSPPMSSSPGSVRRPDTRSESSFSVAASAGSPSRDRAAYIRGSVGGGGGGAAVLRSAADALDVTPRGGSIPTSAGSQTGTAFQVRNRQA